MRNMRCVFSDLFLLWNADMLYRLNIQRHFTFDVDICVHHVLSFLGGLPA